jgi:hypothetical protein
MVAIHPSIPTKFLALQYSGIEFDTKPCSDEALLLGLRKVRALGASNFLVQCDVEVFKDHVEKESKAKQPKLIKYLAEV